jgi:hypothetical protein
MSRPTKYRDTYPIVAKAVLRRGLTLENLAEILDCTRETINQWRHTYPDFDDALREGKAEADSAVEDSLYRRAVGFEYEETKVIAMKGKGGDDAVQRVEKVKKVVVPDVKAISLWLTNRRPDLWREVRAQEISGKDGAPLSSSGGIDLSKLPPEKLTQILEWLGAE